MEAQVNRLVEKLWVKYLDTAPSQRLLIAIGGIPGSGKTTLARMVVAGVNRRQAAETPDAEPVAMAVPMDGFHLTRAQLSAMPDPERAHARRGAEFTFDGAAFLVLVQRLRAEVSVSSSPSSPTPFILAPSFDHAVKDPVADAIAIGSRQRIVVFEGNYVCLDREPWRSAARKMDERWFVDTPDLAVVRARLVRRHVAAGIVADEAAAGLRADKNDLVNGAEILRERLADVDELIVSREDASWA
ncbi:kinase-related protein [Grosmannia clavigera kw1407]|uniref:Kinase-related protein n=1 Tax=Grosmannia clavigera (strain kw1407 / UAMH 11150) TaxID=655863 RepID=F0XCY2_GROCL|nr:kinase-related protein [Grosmannia clavigera kw1407]EFX03494.1 kinase-related protein [Grosmannia clavigera kw1407]